MKKRNNLEIIRDILEIIKSNRNLIKPTPLLRKSNISTLRFKEYFNDLLEKNFIIEVNNGNEKFVSLTEKGFKFLEKYKTIIHFIEEFEL